VVPPVPPRQAAAEPGTICRATPLGASRPLSAARRQSPATAAYGTSGWLSP